MEHAPPPAAIPDGSNLDLTDPSLFFNRELSQLEFHRRVLAQASDPGLPLLERLRFLTISSSVLDEFFEIRVAGLRQQVQLGVDRPGPDGASAQATLPQIAEVVHRLVERQYAVLNDKLVPQLEEAGITVLKRAAWTAGQREWIGQYFREQVLPVLTPVGLDPSHPFPRILNKSLNFIVSVEGDDAFGRVANFAVVQVPRCLPRLVALPSELTPGRDSFVMISSVIHEYVGELFRGMAVTACHQFRVTRNSDLWVDDEETDDLLLALEGELPARHYGQAVRLEVADNCSEEAADFLLECFDLTKPDLYLVNGPVNLHRLGDLVDRVARPELKFPPFVAAIPAVVSAAPDIFAAIRQGDILLHHPYQSFNPVVELARKAASDPDVLAIKQTLYRTGSESPFVQHLIQAAQAGKAVTAVVELRARFDEAANIRWATRLQEAGANVVYGVVGQKTHAKMLMIVRREGKGLRRYVHLGTGNYHVQTARLYTDVGLLSCREDLSRDVHELFLQLTGLGHAPVLEKLVLAPFDLRRRLIELIEFEGTEARAGRPAFIRARMNALTDASVIQAMYRASRDGVTIDLLVRGVCRLRPGVPGLSTNIHVRSVVGRFLEHSRVFWFHAAGEDRVFASSADWMERNLFRRVEVLWPIDDEVQKMRLVEETLSLYLADNVRAWELGSDGNYVRAKPGKRVPREAQLALLGRFAGP
jgi:polyphosphate kinase